MQALTMEKPHSPIDFERLAAEARAEAQAAMRMPRWVFVVYGVVILACALLGLVL